MFTLQFNNFGAIFVIINCLLFYPAPSVHLIFESTRQIFSILSLLLISNHPAKPYPSSSYFQLLLLILKKFLSNQILLRKKIGFFWLGMSSSWLGKFLALHCEVNTDFFKKIFHEHSLHHSLQQPHEPKLLLKVLDPPVASFHVRYSLKLPFSNTAILSGGRRW